MGTRTNSAITAGLIGAACCVAPSVARGATIAEMLDQAFVSPSFAFAAGAAGGAALALGTVGLIALVVRLARARRRGAEAVPDAPTTSFGVEVATDATSSYVPRHMRGVEPDGGSGAERPAARPRGSAARAVTAAGASSPVASVSTGTPAPSHAATDYEQIALNQARSASFRQRMALRAQGVASILRDRMGAGMMDGIPVIERADGSVGDVGTSWWQAAVGEEAMTCNTGFALDDEPIAIPSSFSTDAVAPVYVAPSGVSGTLPKPAPSPADVSERVAYVDEGAYPERRSVDDLSDDDIWTSALKSLDERIAAEVADLEPVEFHDAVGGIDTLDEPDNLELDTAFIPFKTPAGHPEVVDTESYIDYLLADEFEKNSSPAVRHSSRNFLRVLQGGTHPSSRHLADTAEDEPVRGAKHFAVAREA